MAEIVTPENRSLYLSELEEMFEMRYRVAVGELGWTLPESRPGYDKDQFDTDDTVYVLDFGAGRSVRGCCRLIRTTLPHMLTEIFPHYCDLQPAPRSKAVFECSRYFVDRTACADKDERTEARQSIGLGITEFLLSVGATHMTWLTHQALYNHTISVYDSEPLGLPRDEAGDNAAYIAAISKIDLGTWKRQRANLIRPQAHMTFQKSVLTPNGVRLQSGEHAA